MSRTGEAHTVWEVLNPAFIPALFIATFLLLSIVFTSERVAYKLIFVIAHSILIHSLFSIIFPVGDLSGQQMILGRARLVFDNVVFHGWTPWSYDSLQSMVFEWLRGITFQSALSVVFARMLSVDLLWVHLFLVPVLWGIFTPVAVFLTTTAFGGDEKAAIFSSLIIAAFPYATYFGAISVPISLGFIFSFYSFFFTLKNLESKDSKTKVWMVALAFFSFLSHFLTGIISISFIIFAIAFKSYRSETSSPSTGRALLAISFLVCVSLLPLSFIYLRFFSPNTFAVFTLDKLSELPLPEIIGLVFLGELVYGFSPFIILLFIIGPAIAFLWMTYMILKTRGSSNVRFRTRIVFVFVAFLIVLADYRILNLLMSGVPLNEERLWVFQDFIAAPFVALTTFAMFSSLKRFLKAHFTATISTSNLRRLSRGSVFGVLSLSLILNILIPMLLAGWITVSLDPAYPRVAPLQTTWYELEAVKYVEENTHEKYVVIGDSWTIYAGEVIVGVNNPRAYYFLEFNATGYYLFSNMEREPSPQWMLLAMNYTDTAIAYFIVTEPRLGAEQFQNVVSLALKNQQLKVLDVPGVPPEKLRIFSYRKE
jgi:hypothetical protein